MQSKVFQKSRSHHQIYEFVWLLCCIATIIAISTLIHSIYNTTIVVEASKNIYIEIGHIIITNFLILSLLSVLLKISISRYLTERHLRIIYNHRVNVLDMYDTFEAGIDKSSEAINNMRIELAKYMFSDPNFGASQNINHGDLSVSPIINIAEKIASKSNDKT
jgi:hypothetical protein